MRDHVRHRYFLFFFSLVYFLLLIYLLFFAFFRAGTTTRVNLIPLDSIYSLTVYTVKTGEDWWHWIVNVPGNLLAFIPMSVPLQVYIRPRIPGGWYAVLIWTIPMVLECLQYVFKTGSCDVDDVLLNVGGIFFGVWMLGKICGRQPRT